MSTLPNLDFAEINLTSPASTIAEEPGVTNDAGCDQNSNVIECRRRDGAYLKIHYVQPEELYRFSSLLESFLKTY